MTGWKSRRVVMAQGLSLFLCVGLVSALPSREAVLAGVYPEAEVEAERIFLTEEEMETIEEEAGSTFASPLIARYLLKRNGAVVGRAYVETHTVRTKRESLLICLNANSEVLRVETTAFMEPMEYLLPDVWFEQFERREAEDLPQLNRNIRQVAGATLTCIAATRAVRRVLVLDRLLKGRVRS